MKTLQQRYVEALEMRGERVLERKARYVKVSRTKGGFYFCDTAGSVRIGRTRTHSVPAKDEFKAALLNDIVVRFPFDMK